MKPTTRKRLLRYGIPIDLVLLATGVGLIAPRIDPLALIAVFAAAVVLSAWKSGWRAGLTATILGAVLLAVIFGGSVHGKQIGLFTGGGVLVSLLLSRGRRRRRLPKEKEAHADALPGAPVIAMNRPSAEVARPTDDRSVVERETRARAEGERIASERWAAEKAKMVERFAIERADVEKRVALDKAKVEENFAAIQVRIEQEYEQQLERDRAALREVYETEQTSLKASLEAARRTWDSERAGLEKKIVEARATYDSQTTSLKSSFEAARAAWDTERAGLGNQIEKARTAHDPELASLNASFETARVAWDAERAGLGGQIEKARTAHGRELASLKASFEAERATWDAERAGIGNQIEKVRAAHAPELVSLKASFDAAQAAWDAERIGLGNQIEQARSANAPELASLKASLEAERAEWEAERAGLQKQIEEARRAPPAAVGPLDEDALAARVEQMRAEIQERLNREMQPKIGALLAAQRVALERDTAQEIERIRHAADERVATFRAEAERTLAEQVAANGPPRRRRSEQSQPSPPPQKSIFRRLFQSETEPPANDKRRAFSGDSTATRRSTDALADATATRRRTTAGTDPRPGRVLFLETRRTNADTAAPRLKQLGVQTLIVERLVDALEEIDRFRPDIAFLDADLPDFERVYKTMTEQAKNLPLVLTSRNASSIPMIGRSGIAIRPYDIDEIVQFARTAVEDPQSLLAKQVTSRSEAAPRAVAVATRKASAETTEKIAAVPATPIVAEPVTPAVAPQTPKTGVTAAVEPDTSIAADDGYQVYCFNCRVKFDAIEADWCSCLTSDRTVVCTNCLTCFCKAAPSYKEKFWLGAPQRLVDRKAAEFWRHSPVIVPNPPPDGIKRPVVMLVQDDEDIQAIVQRVCANLGYGFVSAVSGEEGLSLARTYRPNLILTDAFTSNLDGREMCRQLKEDPAFGNTTMVVMTGLYTDAKYQAEAIRRFHIDDYVAKPVSITDLINLLQRHLEGVADLPAQENLHELHRKAIEVAAGQEQPVSASTYQVTCATCVRTFDAAKAEWCAHPDPGRSLVCEHCGNCFCKAPVAYQHRFWADAPPMLFERKVIVADRGGYRKNPALSEAIRPLVLLVENDESIQLIVRTVVTSMGYGFISAVSGERGHALAREYSPELIISDAYLPKHDVREIFKLVREDPSIARTAVIMMTGLYADLAFRKVALSQFNADDYLPKPLLAADVIRLLKERLPQEMREITPRPARINTNTSLS